MKPEAAADLLLVWISEWDVHMGSKMEKESMEQQGRVLRLVVEEKRRQPPDRYLTENVGRSCSYLRKLIDQGWCLSTAGR